MGAVIGIPAALLAAGFFALVHLVQSWLWDDLPALLGFAEAPWFLIVGLPLVGAILVVAARALLPGDGGEAPLHGMDPAPTPMRYAPGILLAALASLCFGAILGPEMPVVAIGTVVGTAVARMARAGEPATRVLAMAGAFSAISALFGGPLVAGLLLVEGGLAAGAKLLRILMPGLVAAAIGYTIFIGLGPWGGLPAGTLAVPSLEPYDGTSIPDLAAGMVVGVATAVLIAATRAGGTQISQRASGVPLVTVIGGIAIGLLALAASGLGAAPGDVLFSGQASIPVLASTSSAGLVLVLLTAKAIGYAISLGAGFRGGPIFPAVFLGVAVASIGTTVLGLSPTLAIAMGASAGMAAQARLLISPLLFAALLVGPAGADAMPAAVLATVAAWITATLLESRSTVGPEAQAREDRGPSDPALSRADSASAILTATRE